MASDDEGWQNAKRKATAENPWFIPEFINLSVNNIVEQFLSEEALQGLIGRYKITEPLQPKKVGIVMAGNIPLVGFHDLMCTLLTGHYAMIKPSSKDEALVTFLIKKLKELNPDAIPYFTVSEMLKGCDAYIATGSNNSSTYFQYYFSKYPHIIRKNRTSVAVLTGNETDVELAALADDVYQFFGLGCRNVTKIFVPRNFNFERLLTVFEKYDYLTDYQKYKNNYDYHLAILLLNHKPYMSNESLLLVEDSSVFSPISQLNYEYYSDWESLKQRLKDTEQIQCVVSKDSVAFGAAQQPSICDFADGVDTVEFLLSLS
ncbi:acyl-CoA reductase [Flavisolibacter ginsenosidimutans]